MAALSKDQEKFYQNVKETTKSEFEELGSQIQKELDEVKKKLADIQEARASAKDMHEMACKRLGVDPEIADDEEEEG